MKTTEEMKKYKEWDEKNIMQNEKDIIKTEMKKKYEE